MGFEKSDIGSCCRGILLFLLLSLFFILNFNFGHFIVLRTKQFHLFQIVRREGLSLWQELFPSLVSLANKGPAHVSFVFFLLGSVVYLFHTYLRSASVNAAGFSFSLQAELVSMMLRWLPEDITVHNEDLEGLCYPVN